MSYGDVVDKLERSRNIIDRVVEELKTSPEKCAIVDLLKACEVIDAYYRKEYCDTSDEDYGEPIGTAYKHGISLEFYIESSWWHDVSVQLRKLRDEENS